MTKLPRTVLCLDWDKRALRMVVARTVSGALELEDAHSHRVSADTDTDDPQAMGAFIAQMVRQHRWHHKRVVVDVPRDKVVINRLTLAPTPVNEVAAAVRFQAQKELPFPLESAEIDFVIMKHNERGFVTGVLLAAVRREVLDRLRETCAVAGLVPARIGLRPYANLMSIMHLPELEPKCVLFVEVGPTVTEIDVMREGGLTFSRAANIQVPLVSSAAPAADESTPAESGQTPAAPSADVVRVAVNSLLVEITRTLQAYRASEPDAVIDRIVVAGGTGLEADLLNSLEGRFGLAAQLFDPTNALSVPATDAAKLQSFSAPLGLAWGLSREGLLELDFLNPKRPIIRREVIRRRMRLVGSIVGSVLVVAAGSWAAYLMYERGLLKQEQDTVAKLLKEVRDLERVRNRVEEVTDEWAVEAVWPDHLLTLARSMDEPGKKMVVPQVTFDARQTLISLRVMASDMKTANEFIKKLNDLRRGDRPIYRAAQGTWQELKGGDSGLNGTVDVKIELLELREHYDGAKKRALARKEKLSKI
ncbi:MAG: pilus assembly protein PilM [Planctomycetes bacterium]|nr:pilus assembly protein PilM [Planctomycetota bacterium]